MDILVFGIQGSGKGTQAKALALALNLPIFETGAELRKIATMDTEQGREIKKTIAKGDLVDSQTILEQLTIYFEKSGNIKGIIFDGVPRTYEQALLFDAMMTEKQRKNIVVDIQLSEQDALERLRQRRICDTCGAVFLPDYTKSVCNLCGGNLIHRGDDNPEAIQRRFAKYKSETLPVIEHYRKQGKVISVQGNQAIIDVTKDIFTQLSPLLKLEKDC